MTLQTLIVRMTLVRLPHRFFNVLTLTVLKCLLLKDSSSLILHQYSPTSSVYVMTLPFLILFYTVSKNVNLIFLNCCRLGFQVVITWSTPSNCPISALGYVSTSANFELTLTTEGYNWSIRVMCITYTVYYILIPQPFCEEVGDLD